MSQQTTECLTDSNYIPVGSEFTKNLEKHGLFCISKAQWDLLACSDRMNPWVHAMAHGLSSLNKCCCFAFKRHWLKMCNSRKNTPVIFKAYGYCTFQTCVVTVMLWINQDRDKVAVNVDFHGDINHKVGETHSRNLYLSVKQIVISRFQDTHIAPTKEYCRRLMSLDNEQFVSGNCDGSTSVLQKISSQARLQLEEDKDLTTSLLVLQKMFLNSMPSVNIMRPDSPVRGYTTYPCISIWCHLLQ